MNRIKSIAYFKSLVCLLILVRCTGCSSHLAKIYSRLNQESKRDLDSIDQSSEKYNYPLDKLMHRLGYNSSRETHSNIIDYNFDRLNRSYLTGRREGSTANPLEPPNSLVTHAGNALWKRRSVSGHRPRVSREEYSKESKRKKFAGEEHERSYDKKALYEDGEDTDDEEEDEQEEDEGYQDLDPYSYDTTDHRNVRHGGSYTRFEQSEQNHHQRPNQQMSPTSKKKWEDLGTPKKVDALFLAHRQKPGRRPLDDWMDPSPNPRKQAGDHLVRILKEGKCKWPRPKLIKVSESYPSMSKTYSPSCTVLFRCGEDTGCCSHQTQKCTAKNSTTVELYFTTIRTEYKEDGNRTVRNDIEKLTFTNDTECDCVEMMPRDDLDRSADTKPKTGCTCPTEFSVRYMSNGSCTCDCFDKQNDCLRYKRGLKYFDHQDRLCIAEGRCEKPQCRFGVYEHKYGRCPKRHEKFQKFSKYSY